MQVRGLVLALPLIALLGGCNLVGTMMTPVTEPAPLTGWTAIPSEPDPAYLAAAERDCVPRFQDAMTPFIPEEVIQDQRGNRAMFIFQSRTAEAEGSCEIIEGRDGSLTWSGGWSAGTWSPGRELWLESWGSSSNVGDVPARTARVEIVTDSGQTIQATVAHGRFIAWWPDPDPSTTITAYDASGSVIASIPGGRPSEPDPS